MLVFVLLLLIYLGLYFVIVIMFHEYMISDHRLVIMRGLKKESEYLRTTMAYAGKTILCTSFFLDSLTEFRVNKIHIVLSLTVKMVPVSKK